MLMGPRAAKVPLPEAFVRFGVHLPNVTSDESWPWTRIQNVSLFGDERVIQSGLSFEAYHIPPPWWTEIRSRIGLAWQSDQGFASNSPAGSVTCGAAAVSSFHGWITIRRGSNGPLGRVVLARRLLSRRAFFSVTSSASDALP